MAVKVLMHEGSRARKLNAMHESLVSAAVHHPNVVRSSMESVTAPPSPPRALRGAPAVAPDTTAAQPRGSFVSPPFHLATISAEECHSRELASLSSSQMLCRACRCC